MEGTEGLVMRPVADSPPVHVTAYRTEVKIPLPSVLLGDVKAWVMVHPAHWRRTYPPRQVNNIYFDTLGLASLNTNLGGVGVRSKLRLRWYGDQLSRVADAQLELKRKRGTTGWKEIVAVGVDLDLSDARWPEVAAALDEAAGGTARLWLQHFPLPVLVSCYRRDYYATSDGEIRLTVDSDLRAYGQRSTCVPNLSVAASLGDQVVIELKASADALSARRVNDALSYLPPSADRFSKYVSGVLGFHDFR